MEIVQHAVVTLVALAAAAVLCRRVFGFVGLRAGRAECAACPSAQGSSGAPTQPTSGAAVQHRLTYFASTTTNAASSSAKHGKVESQLP